tara:strand:+ start:688 stop:945 length:258 start_codon:yes stop_codon:yes gene_type:complete
MNKKELEIELDSLAQIIERQNVEVEQLKETNISLNNYVNQLRVKLQEVALMLSQYEKTVLLMAGRLQEKDTIISEQQNGINKRSE